MRGISSPEREMRCARRARMGQGAKERHKSFLALGFAGGCGTRTRGDSYDNKLRAHEKRIVAIEAKQRGVLATASTSTCSLRCGASVIPRVIRSATVGLKTQWTS
jgi:hypothetical protein